MHSTAAVLLNREEVAATRYIVERLMSELGKSGTTGQIVRFEHLE